MADVDKKWEAGCVPHGAREVDGSGADAEGGFRHPQPGAADVERERVTALWREAAAAIGLERELNEALDDPNRGEWGGYPWEHLGDAERDVRALLAKCGRLREQLDATRRHLREGLSIIHASSDHPERLLEGKPSGLDDAWDEFKIAFSRARAALGVVGKQENHGE